MKNGICKLCNNTKDLCNSHIVPRYVRIYMVETSSAIRNFKNPNQRVQDIYKDYLLCKECEDKFSIRERTFQKAFFNPYHKGILEFPYDEQLQYFMISVLWRVAISGINTSIQEGSPSEILLNELKENWRQYLIGNRNPPLNSSLHLFLADDLDEVFPEQVVARKHVYSYFKRTLDVRTMSDDNNLIIFVKLPGILLLSYIGATDDEFINTEVNTSGTFIKGNQKLGIITKELFSHIINDYSERIDTLQLNEKSLQQITGRLNATSLEELLSNEDFLARIKDSGFQITFE